MNSRSPWLPQSPAAGPPGPAGAARTSAGSSSQRVNSYSRGPVRRNQADRVRLRALPRAGQVEQVVCPPAAPSAGPRREPRGAGQPGQRPRPVHAVPAARRRRRRRSPRPGCRGSAERARARPARRGRRRRGGGPRRSPRRAAAAGRAARRPAGPPAPRRRAAASTADLPPADQRGGQPGGPQRARPAGRASRAARKMSRSPRADLGERQRLGGRGPPRARRAPPRGRCPSRAGRSPGRRSRPARAPARRTAVTNTALLPVERGQRPPGPRAAPAAPARRAGAGQRVEQGAHGGRLARVARPGVQRLGRPGRGHAERVEPGELHAEPAVEHRVAAARRASRCPGMSECGTSRTRTTGLPSDRAMTIIRASRRPRSAAAGSVAYAHGSPGSSADAWMSTRSAPVRLHARCPRRAAAAGGRPRRARAWRSRAR